MSELTAADLGALLEAARKLPPAVGTYLDDDYVICLLSTVVDYQLQTPVVVKALEHFRQHCWSEVGSLADLRLLFARYPDDKPGNTDLGQYLWGFKLWTRAALLRRLTEYFAERGAVDLDSLKRWAEQSDFKRDFEGRVRFSHDGTTFGLGGAKYNWLTMRLGAQTVKPDVHVHAFIQRSLGRRLSDQDAVDAVKAAAVALGIPPRELDWRIWEAGQGMAQGPERPPSEGERAEDRDYHLH